MENTEKENLKLETATSKCHQIPSDKEFEELFQTKRENPLPKKVDLLELSK